MTMRTTVPPAHRKVEKILIGLTRSDRRRIERVARDRGISLAAVGRLALSEFLTREENGSAPQQELPT